MLFERAGIPQSLSWRSWAQANAVVRIARSTAAINSIIWSRAENCMAYQDESPRFVPSGHRAMLAESATIIEVPARAHL